MDRCVEQFIQSRVGDGLSNEALTARVQARRFSAAALEAGTLSADCLVRQIVASLEVQPRLLSLLAHDIDPIVRLAVAGNQGTPDHVLVCLAEDATEMVSLSARTELRCREQIRPA